MRRCKPSNRNFKRHIHHPTSHGEWTFPHQGSPTDTSYDHLQDTRPDAMFRQLLDLIHEQIIHEQGNIGLLNASSKLVESARHTYLPISHRYTNAPTPGQTIMCLPSPGTWQPRSPSLHWSPAHIQHRDKAGRRPYGCAHCHVTRAELNPDRSLLSSTSSPFRPALKASISQATGQRPSNDDSRRKRAQGNWAKAAHCNDDLRGSGKGRSLQ